MNNLEEIKRIITPIMVAHYYLGQPTKSGNRLWYKSPFRKERTASFMATNEGFHDFGDGWHGDIIDFIGRYFNTDFINAIKILCKDFGLPDNEPMSKDMEMHLKRQREQEQRMKQNLENWYNATLNSLCDELHLWQKIIPHVTGEALAIAYAKEQYLDYLIDEFIDATEEDKVNLWKERETLQK